MSALDLALLALLLATAVWTVLTRELMRAVLGLALTSLGLTLILFRLDAALAGVFELSVCAGLITVVFISTISLTSRAAALPGVRQPARWRRYVALPVVLVVAGALLSSWGLSVQPSQAPPAPPASAAQVLWYARRFDLLGQLLVTLAGVFGVVVLFKARGAAGEGTRP
jgi:NADH-quinone oxidoreductase subunit J